MQNPQQMSHNRLMKIHRRQVGVGPGGPGGDEDEVDQAADTPATSAAPSTVQQAETSLQQVQTTSPAATTTAPLATSAAAAATTTSALTTSAATSTLLTSTVTTTTSVAPVTTTRPTTTPRPSTRTTTSASRSIVVSYSLTHTPSSTAAADNADAAPVGTIIGIIAGGLVGVVVVAGGIAWLFRKWSRRKDNKYRSEFMRNSMALPDTDYSEKPPMGTKNALNLARSNTYGARPPTMIEQRMNRAGTGVGAGSTPSFQPGEVFDPAVQSYGYHDQAGGHYSNAPATGAGYDQNAYGHNNYDYGNAGYDQNYDYNAQTQYPPQASYGYTPPNESQQSELTRRPSGPGQSYLSRKASQGAALNVTVPRNDPSPFSPAGTDHSSEDPSRRSITPYQQQQYNEINKQLGFDQPHNNYPPQPSDQGGNLGRALSTTYSSLNPHKPSPTATDGYARSGTPTDPNPQQVYVAPSANKNLHPQQGATGQTTNNRNSVFDADDAYGGM